MYLSRKKKVFIAIVLTIAIGGGALFSLTARLAGATYPTIDIKAIQQLFKGQLDDKQKEAFKRAATLAINKAAQSFLNRVAYDTAVFLAEGGPGKTSLQRRESFGRIIRKSGDAALGDFLQDLSAIPIGDSSLTSLGLNLCNPSAALKLSISLQLLDEAKPPRDSKCDISKIKDNWNRIARSASVTGNLGFGDSIGFSASSLGFDVPWDDVVEGQTIEKKFETLTELFSPKEAELGQYVALTAKARKDSRDRATAAQQDYTKCDDFRNQIDNIDNEYIQRGCNEIAQLEEENRSQKAQDYADSVKAGSNSIFLNAAKIFANTFIAKKLKSFIKGRSFTIGRVDPGTNLNEVRSNIVQQLRFGNVSPTDFFGAQEVASALADLRKPTLQNIHDYDYLSELTQCPQNRNQVKLDNCTIDDDFAAAVREKLTVQEAIDQGRLRPDLPLISNLNIGLNGDPFCIREGYCQSNIVRLRKYRIIPIGWEIAASLSPIDGPITLGEAVDCFDHGGNCRLTVAENIFYRLIDPNWVLKAPETQCKAFGIGPKLQDIDLAERQEFCADPVSYLGEDDNGNCTGGFGYCTQEKNTWRFSGTQCPAQYASCQTFTRTVDTTQFSYLSNTVDGCDASQAGCRWYSRSLDNIGTESDPIFAWNPLDRIYLNREAQECSATGPVVTLVESASGVPSSMRKPTLP